jgi:titin
MTVSNILGPGGNPDLCGRTRATSFACSMGDLAPGETASLTFTGSVPLNASVLLNSAVAQGCTGLSVALLPGLPCANAGGTFVTTTADLSVNAVTSAPAATAPGAPTGVTATAGDASANVTWIAPVNTGGSAISSYSLSAFAAGASTPAAAPVVVVAPTTSAVVPGLTNGTAYTFTVTATNAVGSSPASAASNSVTPAAPVVVVQATAPSAPTGVAATAGDASATVTWVAPASDGGSAITTYTVTSSPNSAPISVAAPATSAIVPGLSNGTAYTFTVTASNAVGSSPASVASNSVTPVAPVTAPTAPSNVVATAGNASATVTWSAPANTGGAAITSYTVAAFAAGSTTPAVAPVSVAAPASTARINGLVNGTAYTFTVLATNSAGTSPASLASNSVTPTAPVVGAAPAAPADVRATPDNGSASVSWTAPAGLDLATARRVRYIVSVATVNGQAAASPSVTVVQAPTTSAKISGLTNGFSYTFVVRTMTQTGVSDASAQSNPVVPTQGGAAVVPTPAPVAASASGGTSSMSRSGALHLDAVVH